MVNMQALQKVLSPIKRKVQLLIDRAVVTSVNNSLKRQNLQLTALHDENVNHVERFTDYGLVSFPPDGAEAVIVSPGGNRNAMVAVSADHKDSRPTGGEPGDSGLYHLEGHLFLLTKDGAFELSGSRFTLNLDSEVIITTPKLTVNAEQTTFNGSIEVTGSVTANEVNATQTLSVDTLDVGNHYHLDAEDRPTQPPTQ